MADAPLTPGPTRLHLALTLPGAVSLGSYHGGALAALLVAAQQAGGQIVIDAMATASAGSLTGVLAARSLLTGADPVRLMARAWVEADSLKVLRSRGTDSVLSPEPLRELAADLLDANGSVPDGGTGVARQREAVHISMSLASLGGLGYLVPSVDPHQTTFQALTHLDWWNGRFTVDGPPGQFAVAAEPALASAANALGFPPVLIDRSPDRATYERNHVLNLPPPGQPWPVWYTDGGTIDNEPFGRAIELVSSGEEAGDIPLTGAGGHDAPAEGKERLFLLVEPQPATVDHDGRWWDADYDPNWTFTLFDVFNLKGAQSIYDDLLALQKTNSRVRWTRDATETIDAALRDALDAVPPERRDEVDRAVTEALSAALGRVIHDKQALDEARGGLAGDDADPSVPTAPTGPTAPIGDRSAVLRELVERSTGMRGKRNAVVEMVSPLLDGDSPPIADRLAGDFLFHFGGFVDEDFRRHDFLVGWSNMRTWLASRAERHGFTAALAEVDRRRDALGWELGDLNPSIGSLPLGDKWQLLRTAAHVGHVISHDILELVDRDDDTTG